jgi:hypothetical protein
MEIPLSSAIILVSVLPKPRDFEIAKVLGWYRIPMRYAPKMLDVDYLAFYQPSSFGSSHRWRIEFLAEVRGNELTTRQELFRDEPDHPRAQEEYYKIQLGPLITLGKPIMAGQWKRLTFLYTLGDIFQKAETLDDLILKSDHRQLLWKTLKERPHHSGGYHFDESAGMDIDATLLALLGDFKKISESPIQKLD